MYICYVRHRLPIVTFRDGSRMLTSIRQSSLHWQAGNMGVDPFSIEALDQFDLQQGQDVKNRSASHPPLWSALVEVDQALKSDQVAALHQAVYRSQAAYAVVASKQRFPK